MNFLVADAETVDDGFAAETGDFDEILERGLAVGIPEGIIGGGGGVPL